MPTPPYTAHVVSHTHWDREWYRTFQEFRWRLVELIDFLLDLLESTPEYQFFYLDGQTIVLEDYLEICPENRERLKKLFDAGRLYAGPWYIQPDEFLVSGEATIRNLLLGKKQTVEWGDYTKIGYAPDAFGHISQTPQILRGFGIDNAVLFRGITTDQADSEFRWQSPDGSEVLCIKMPDDTAYSNFFYHFRNSLSATPWPSPPGPLSHALRETRASAAHFVAGEGEPQAQAEHTHAPGEQFSPPSPVLGGGAGGGGKRSESLIREQVLQEARGLYDESLAQRPNTNALLWMDGVDHIFPQPRTPQIIAMVNEGMKGEVTAIHSTLPAFVEAVRAARPDLKTVVGELRHTNRMWRLQALLVDVASSRIHLKQRNHACETLLERYAEPYAAIASRLGKPHPTAFLAHAWKHLLQNQPHDSLCGCSVDQVHKDMLYRFDQCEILGEKIVRDSLSHIAAQVDTSIPKLWYSPPDNPIKTLMPDPLAALVVFNPLAWPRTEIVETIVELPTRLAPQDGKIAIRGPQGDAIPCQIYSISDYHTLNQAAFDIPVGEMHKRWKVSFPAAVPAFGYQTYYVIPESPDNFPPVALATANSLENAFLKVEIAEDGTLTITNKETGYITKGGLVLEDGGDIGDGYNYIKPEKDKIVLGKIRHPEDGTANSIGGELITELKPILPVGRKENGRNEIEQESWIFADVSLMANERCVRVGIFCNNLGFEDHRLRVLFPTGLKDATHSYAEQAFDVVERPIAVPQVEGWKEAPHGRNPMKTFVDVSDGNVGFALINRGLPQYEVLDTPPSLPSEEGARGGATLALTLLRATGNGVGTPEQQEEGQMPGTYTFEFALYPHAGDWEQGRVWEEAHNFNAPLRAIQTDCHDGTLPRAHSFFTVGPDTLVPTTLKLGEDGKSLIFRAFNIGSEPIPPEVKPSDRLNLPAPTRVRLDEEPDPDAAETLPPKRIATWKFAVEP